MENEIWKPIVGYDGYEVSNLGNVRSLNYKHTGNIKKLTLVISYYGYYVLYLYKKGKRKQYKVHRLVAEAFLPNTNNLPFINHKDECKTNNFVWINEDGTIDPEKSNLEWCSVAYNNTYNDKAKKQALKRTKPVKQLDKNGNIITIWPSIMEAKRNGFNAGCICACCNNKLKTHRGCLWAYC